MARMPSKDDVRDYHETEPDEEVVYTAQEFRVSGDFAGEHFAIYGKGVEDESLLTAIAEALNADREFRAVRLSRMDTTISDLRF